MKLFRTARLLCVSCVLCGVCRAQRGAEGQARALSEQVHRLVEDARAKAAAGEPEGAKALLTQALGLSPNSPEANLALGRLLLDARQWPEAMDRFETVLATDVHADEARAGELKAATSLALQARHAGNQDAALRCLEHARESLPDDPELLRDLGVQAFEMHLLALAAEAMHASLAVAPGDVQTMYALSRVELEQQQPEAAEKHLRAYLEARPGDATAHYGLGHLLQMQMRRDEAAAEFHRSIELQPLQTESYYQLGQMALDDHRDEEAAPLFRQTLSRAPKHGGALTGLGILDFRAKRYEDARKSLESAVAASPEYQPAHFYLGLTLGRTGDKDGSGRELAMAAELAAKQQDRSKPVAPGTLR